MGKHKHADLIVQWANGATIQYKNSYGDWINTESPTWYAGDQYRIKPKNRKLTPCWLWASKDGAITLNLYSEYEILKELIDDYPIKLLWSETLMDLGDEE